VFPRIPFPSIRNHGGLEYADAAVFPRIPFPSIRNHGGLEYADAAVFPRIPSPSIRNHGIFGTSGSLKNIVSNTPYM
jgi:hypothetical protein